VSAAAGARLTIDLDALAANYSLLRDRAGTAETAAVVKADAYGLGAGPVARRLWNEGARSFFVARLSEGLHLRRELGARPAEILVFDGLLAKPEEYRAAALTPVLNSVDQARRWMAEHSVGGVLQVDTGMNRLGVTLDEAARLAAEGLAPSLVMSHLACASEPTHPMNRDQWLAFAAARDLFPAARASLANSAGVFLGEDYHFDLVRPGIALYGGSPFSAGEPVGLETVARLHAPILQVRCVEPGDAVGYGADWRAPRRGRVAIVAAGYADGVMRSVAPGVRLAGLEVVGRISMDMLAVDVTDTPHTVGDEIEIFGDMTTIDDFAAAAQTIAYEILTRISDRITILHTGSV
jgi:alanine racemase